MAINSRDHAFAEYFDADWLNRTHNLIDRYRKAVGALPSERSHNSDKWLGSREGQRANALYRASTHCHDDMQAAWDAFLRRQAPEIRERLSALADKWRKTRREVEDLDDKLARILRQKDPTWQRQLRWLVDERGVPLGDLMTEIYSGGIFARPDERGRPRGARKRTGRFTKSDQLKLAAKAADLTFIKKYSRKRAVQLIVAPHYTEKEQSFHLRVQKDSTWPTIENARKAIYPLYDEIMLRLEVRRLRLALKK